MTATTKTRSHIYLDSQLKKDAKRFFQSYGLNLSSGISFLLKQTLDKKVLEFNNLEIEPILPDDPDYKLIQEAKKRRKDGEKVYTLEEVMEEFNAS